MSRCLQSSIAKVLRGTAVPASLSHGIGAVSAQGGEQCWGVESTTVVGGWGRWG